MSNKNLKNFLLIVLLAALWGPSFLFIKIAIEFFPPITLTAIRVGVAAAVLFVILKIRKAPLPKLSKIWKKFSIAALLQSAIPFTLFAVGEKSIDSSLAAIICGASPLFTMVLAHFYIQDDKFTKVKVIGSITGFLGLFILVAPSMTLGLSSTLGIIEVLIAASCYAIAFVFVKKTLNFKDFALLAIPMLQLFFSFLFLMPLSLIFENYATIKSASGEAILSTIALSFLGTAFAFVIYYKIIAVTSATYASMVNYIVPIFGAILGMIVLDEKLTWNSYLGCILIIFGVMIANKILSFAHLKKFIR